MPFLTTLGHRFEAIPRFEGVILTLKSALKCHVIVMREYLPKGHLLMRFSFWRPPGGIRCRENQVWRPKAFRVGTRLLLG